MLIQRFRPTGETNEVLQEYGNPNFQKASSETDHSDREFFLYRRNCR